MSEGPPINPIEVRLQVIEARNARVDADKKWETSLFRRFCIALLTYICVVPLLFQLGTPIPFANALVPVSGYLLSTPTLRVIKQWWLKNHKKD